MSVLLDRSATVIRPTPVPSAAEGRPAVAPTGRLGRLGAVALVAGAAANTAQAVLMHTVSPGSTNAARLADVDAHPTAVLAMVLVGLLGVVLLMVGLQAVARAVRAHAPRAATAGAVLTFVGTLGFLGMHVLMLVTYALADFADRATAVRVLDHLDASPLFLLALVPFLVGMFGGVAALTWGLWRSAGTARWIPVCWALFLPLDLAAAGAGPVDPHWLFLAGAAGLALTARRPAPAAPRPAKS